MNSEPVKGPRNGWPWSDADALAPGTRCAEFEIVRVLGAGGFGIVYLARDHALQREVALKEYMPRALAVRGPAGRIGLRSPACAAAFEAGLHGFLGEARLLAQFEHPSLVRVYRHWEEGSTAFIAMPYLQGVTLHRARRSMARAPDEVWMRAVIDPLLAVLEMLHGAGVLHRDVAPDNIVLLPRAQPVLLDFGAARAAGAAQRTQAAASVKPGYAPLEQYAETALHAQGPWTDLHALGAVMHFMVHGQPPPAARTRHAAQAGAPIETAAAPPGVSTRFLAAMAWALTLQAEHRPRSAAALRAALGHRMMPAPPG